MESCLLNALAYELQQCGWIGVAGFLLKEIPVGTHEGYLQGSRDIDFGATARYQIVELRRAQARTAMEANRDGSERYDIRHALTIELGRALVYAVRIADRGGEYIDAGCMYEIDRRFKRVNVRDRVRPDTVLNARDPLDFTLHMRAAGTRLGNDLDRLPPVLIDAWQFRPVE
jgi:hypothetical protein